jgi:cell division protein FtsI (penicillin-binding protein 3)
MVIVVILDEPVCPGTGGLLAAPVFREIAMNTLRFRNVMPEGIPELLDGDDKRESASQDRGGSENFLKQGKQGERYFPDLYGLSLLEAMQLLEGYPVRVEIQGSGRVISQRPSPGTVLHEGDRCVLEASPLTQERKDLSPLT